jgi:hypothetical protein
VNVTGGVVQILVANAIAGNYLQGSIVTATNVFDFDDEIDISQTVTTAFTDGEAEVILLVEPK